MPETVVRPTSKYWSIGVRYDQGVEGSCVGQASAAYASWWYRRKSVLDNLPGVQTAKYDAQLIYHTAQDKYDPWEGSNYEGTSTDAGMQVLRNEGAQGVTDHNNVVKISEYKWAENADQLFDWLSTKGPCVLGMDWFENFDRPKKHTFPGKSVDFYFIGEGDLGNIRGGHCIIAHAYRRLDGREWIRLQNSWGYSYPLVWVPRETIVDLFTVGSLEAVMITQTPFFSS